MTDYEFKEGRKVSDIFLVLDLGDGNVIPIEDEAILSIEDIYGNQIPFLARKLENVRFARVGYLDYMNSEDWRKRRELYFLTHPRKCYFCGSEDQIQLHHLTYDRLGREADVDLEALCEKCHKNLHFFADIIGNNPAIERIEKHIPIIGEVIPGHKPHVAYVIKQTINFPEDSRKLIPFLLSKRKGKKIINRDDMKRGISMK